MNAKDAVVQRIYDLCKEKDMKINALANESGQTPSTIYSILDASRRDVGISAIKKICDGFDITLGQFFSAPIFDHLDQEIFE